MREKLKILNQINKFDLILMTLVFSVPLFLSISIFISDFFTSLAGLLFLFIIWNKENLNIIKKIKKELFFFLIFFSIILISLILSDYKEQSFLASFFYFRYFLLSMIIFYLLNKYENIYNLFYYIILFSFSFVVIDSLIQLIFNYNILGYQKMGFKPYSPFDTDVNNLMYLTSFFNEEKKLGSYLIRFLPLLISLIFLKNYNPKILSIIFLVIIGFIIFQTSERVALFLLGIFCLFYVINSKKKILLFTTLIFSVILLFNLNYKLKHKYIIVTLQQTNIIHKLYTNELGKKFLEKIGIADKYWEPVHYDIPRYYSKEHEDLSFTALLIVKDNIWFGSGVKTFFHKCHELKEKNIKIETNRNNKLVCSTHPHNTYLQIFSEIGIFGFLISIFFLGFLIKNIIKILIMKNKDYLDNSYFFINLGLLLNVLPLIPSGSIFNNWISLVFFFNLGFLFIIRNKIENRDNL